MMNPLAATTGIRLRAAGTRKWLTIPAIDSGWVYFSVGRALGVFQSFVNPGGGIVMPSVTKPADANADVEFAFCELTLDGNGVYANISFVDFVSLAMSPDAVHDGRPPACLRLRPKRSGRRSLWVCGHRRTRTAPAGGI
jgi:hypothetical protein